MFCHVSTCLTAVSSANLRPKYGQNRLSCGLTDVGGFLSTVNTVQECQEQKGEADFRFRSSGESFVLDIIF